MSPVALLLDLTRRVLPLPPIAVFLVNDATLGGRDPSPSAPPPSHSYGCVVQLLLLLLRCRTPRVCVCAQKIKKQIPRTPRKSAEMLRHATNAGLEEGVNALAVQVGALRRTRPQHRHHRVAPSSTQLSALITEGAPVLSGRKGGDVEANARQIQRSRVVGRGQELLGAEGRGQAPHKTGPALKGGHPAASKRA